MSWAVAFKVKKKYVGCSTAQAALEKKKKICDPNGICQVK